MTEDQFGLTETNNNNEETIQIDDFEIVISEALNENIAVFNTRNSVISSSKGIFFATIFFNFRFATSTNSDIIFIFIVLNRSMIPLIEGIPLAFCILD